MSFSIGIIGLPNAGKSTLFSLLTEKEVGIESYPFTTIDPNVGIVKVPDKRLDRLAETVNPEKKLYPTIKFIDIAGLIEGAHKGEGLGNKFLSHIRPCDSLVHVIKAYEKNERPTPEKDKKTIENELLMKDLELLEKLEEKLKDDERLSLIKRMKTLALNGKPLKEMNLSEEEEGLIKEFQFLTLKPVFNLYNGKGEGFSLDLKMEEEVKELSEKERRELGVHCQLDEFLTKCYNNFSLITFFTIAKGKVQGWTIEKGTSASKAGGKVHSDFEENFKRAEVTDLDSLKSAKSFEKARTEGKVKTVGADYEVKNGDIIEFKI